MTQRLTIDDANQVRAGVEYAINLSSDPARPRALAVRGGLAYDPQHQSYFQADDPQTGMPAPRWALMFQKGEDDVHVSAGLGVVFGRLQFDAAPIWLIWEIRSFCPLSHYGGIMTNMLVAVEASIMR